MLLGREADGGAGSMGVYLTGTLERRQGMFLERVATSGKLPRSLQAVAALGRTCAFPKQMIMDAVIRTPIQFLRSGWSASMGQWRPSGGKIDPAIMRRLAGIQSVLQRVREAQQH